MEKKGLLDFIGTPEGQGLLATVFGGMAGARRGQPLNSLGRAGMAGLMGYGNALDRDAQAGKDAQARNIDPAILAREEWEYRKNNPVLTDVRTSEQKNWDFGNTLSPEQRAQFMAGNKASAEPSSIQEWNAYQSMTPAQQQAFREMKRATQMVDMGGFVAPAIGGGKLGQPIPKTLTPGDLPAIRGAQAEATSKAAAGVTQQVEATKKVNTADTLISQIGRAEAVLSRGNASGSLLGAGVSAAKGAVGMSDASTQDNQALELISGWMTANVPRMEGPQSVFDVQNYAKMAAVVGDKTKPIADRQAALQELRTLQGKYKEVMGGVAVAAKPPGKQSSSQPPTPMKGMIRNGYKFKGGDPADQSNWERQ